MRSATTVERGYFTPYEMIKGMEPSILKMHRFVTLAFVALPRQKRKMLAKKVFLGRAEMGRLLGFHRTYSSTLKVLLTANRVAPNINVAFNDSNYVHGSALPHMQQPQNEEHMQLPGADARQDGVIRSPDADAAANAATKSSH